MGTNNDTKIVIPKNIIKHWQNIVDILATTINVPVALIMQIDLPYIKVFSSSKTPNNPYKVGDKEHLHNSGLYCEHVIKTQRPLQIANALKISQWNKNPDIKLGMIAYLGYPLQQPDGKPFGTLCILDSKEHHFNKNTKKLMLEFSALINAHIALLYHKKFLETKVSQKTAKLQETTKKLTRRLSFEKIISKILGKFISVPTEKIDAGVKHALKALGMFLKIEGNNICLFSKNHKMINIIYQWAAPGYKSNLKKHNKIQGGSLPTIIKQIKNNKVVYIPNVDKAPSLYRIEKRYWKQQKIKSLLYLPFYLRGKCAGFTTFYAKKNFAVWDETTISSLQIAIKIIVDAVSNKYSDLREIEHMKNAEEALIKTIQSIAHTLEKRDPYTAGHQNRVALLATAIAQEMKLPEERIKGIKFGALIHDIGKIYVPSEILNRPGKLTNTELEIIKSHPSVGYDIIKEINFPWPIAEMILGHHERLDKSGYPNKLNAKDIMLECQILAVADVVEAMTAHRPYRPALGIEQALQEIKENRDKLYNPKVVDVCINLFKKKNFKF